MSAKNYESIYKMIYDAAGRYEIPSIEPCSFDESKVDKWIPFNYAMSESKKDVSNVGVQFFLDDYQFERLWNNTDRYLPVLSQFAYVLSPDFSMFTDFPVALQIYNHYRKHWIAAYLQQVDINVIPTIAWSDERSYDFCFDGEPIGGTVAVCSTGCLNSKRKTDLFLNGYNEMLERLKPTGIIFFGKIPEGCEGNIIPVKTFADTRFTKEK